MSTLNQTKPKVNRNIHTHEGGSGYKAVAEEELTLLVLGSLLQDSFYEKSNVTLRRMWELAGKVSKAYLLKLATVARNDFNMRTTPSALLGMYTLLHGQPPETSIRGVFLRGDEIGDYLGTVSALSSNQKITPSAVRFARKVLQSTLTERKALRYSNSGRTWSLAKAIRISHARMGATPKQSALFNFVLRWHNTKSLTAAWEETPSEDRQKLPLMKSAVLGEDTGEISWERKRSDGASWNDLVDEMGYMATLRNLRNFTKDPTFDRWDTVMARVSDPEEVRNSKQFPYRFLAALKNVTQPPLQDCLRTALHHSVGNLPPLEGRTLVVIDTSGSMNGTLSERSEMRYVDIAALFGASMNKLNPNSAVVAFGSRAELVDLGDPDADVYDGYNDILENERRWRLGYGTNLNEVFNLVDANRFKNIVLFSDMQVMDYHYRDSVRTLLDGYQGNFFSVNLAAYEAQLQRVGKFYAVGGWSDATLKVISQIEKGDIVEWVKGRG